MVYKAKSKVRIIPWDSSSAVDIDEMYTQLTWLKDHRRPSGVTQNKLGSYTEIFNGGKRLLVYGRPGMQLIFFISSKVKKYQVRYSTNVYMGRLRPEVQTITLSCTIFHEKGTPFIYLLLTNGTPFTYLVCDFATLLTAVNTLSFQQKSVTKIERFLDFISYKN